MVAETINLLNVHHVDNEDVSVGEIQTLVQAGLSPVLRAKVVYQNLYRQIDDKYVKKQ